MLTDVEFISIRVSPRDRGECIDLTVCITRAGVGGEAPSDWRIAEV